MPQVLPTAFLQACRLPIALSHLARICGPQFSFLSSVTPRYTVLLTRGTSVSSTVSGLSSELILLFVKSIAVVLTPLNLSPLLWHQELMRSRSCWAMLLMVEMHIPRIKMTRSSANAWTKLL